MPQTDIERLLNDPALKKTFEDLHKRMLAEFLRADCTPEKLMDIWRQGQSLLKLERHLQSKLFDIKKSKTR